MKSCSMTEMGRSRMHILIKKVYFMGRLVIDGENVYELDEECLQEKHKEELRQKRLQHTKTTDQSDSNQQKRKF